MRSLRSKGLTSCFFFLQVFAVAHETNFVDAMSEPVKQLRPCLKGTKLIAGGSAGSIPGHEAAAEPGNQAAAGP